MRSRKLRFRSLLFLFIVIAALAAFPVPARADSAEAAKKSGESAEFDPALKAEWEQLMSDSEMARRSGAYENARMLCAEAIKVARRFPTNTTFLARSQVQMGDICLSDRKFPMAEQFFKEAVASCESALGPNHPVMAMPLESLANGYFRENKYDEAVPLYDRILKIAEHGARMQELEVARRARNLADAYFSARRYAEAEPLYMRALRLAEPSGETNAVIELQLAAGRFYDVWKKPGEAGKHYEQAAGLAESIANDFQAFQSLQALTDLFRAERDYSRAENAATRALKMREKAIGPDAGTDAQLDVAVCLDNLAEVYLAWSKPEKAEPLYRRSLDIVEKIGGGETSESVRRRIGLAAALRGLGMLDQAEFEYQRALALTEKNVGPEGSPLAIILDKYATLLDEMKKPAEAKAQSVRAESIRKKAAAP
jgi:tetratricopeptide (TPR) repeat protein